MSGGATVSAQLRLDKARCRPGSTGEAADGVRRKNAAHQRVVLRSPSTAGSGDGAGLTPHRGSPGSGSTTGADRGRCDAAGSRAVPRTNDG